MSNWNQIKFSHWSLFTYTPQTQFAIIASVISTESFFLQAAAAAADEKLE
jgi:hypothetical protein